MKQICYYELLGIAQRATVEEIRKAYKVKALQLHPDKNHHRLEDATREFTVLQQAYTVLIDPHERRWYDNHRDAILKGGSGVSGVDEDSMFDLMSYFNASAYKGFNDGPKGFFTVYRKIFEDIEAEENRIYEALKRNKSNEYDTIPMSAATYTSFGSASTCFLPSLKEFYAKWTHFNSLRSFSSMDKYHPGEAENRLHRRHLEKENKKLREAQRKEYNDTVKSLALFIKKRDPRVLAYQTQAKEAAELKSKKEKETKKSLKAERDESFEEQGWAKVDDNEYLKYFKIHKDDVDMDPESEFLSDTAPEWVHGEEGWTEPTTTTHVIEEEAYYCPACNKTFKSEQQWTNHEQSKKHLKQVHAIKKILKKEERMLNKQHGLEQPTSKAPVIESDSESESRSRSGSESKASFKSDQGPAVSDFEQIDEQALEKDLDEPNENVNLKSVASHLEQLSLSTDSENEVHHAPSKTALKKTKKKRRRAVKEESVDPSLKCLTCAQYFDSRNALFKHLKSSKHGTPLKP